MAVVSVYQFTNGNEAGSPVQFYVARDTPDASSLTVNLSHGGTASATDFTSYPTSITIDPWMTDAMYVLSPQNDTLDEGIYETVILNVASGTGYTIGTGSATGYVFDNDIDAATVPVPTTIFACPTCPCACETSNGQANSSGSTTANYWPGGSPGPAGSSSIWAGGSPGPAGSSSIWAGGSQGPAGSSSIWAGPPGGGSSGGIVNSPPLIGGGGGSTLNNLGGLRYDSSSAQPIALMQANGNFGLSQKNAQGLDVEFFWNGDTFPTKEKAYVTTDLDTYEDYRFAAAVSAAGLGTGFYPWSIDIKTYNSGTSMWESNIVNSGLKIIDRTDSEFSPGWSSQWVDRLKIQGNGALWSLGDGRSYWFSKDVFGNYHREAGEDDYSTLNFISSQYILTKRSGEKLTFNSSGLQTKREDRYGNEITYAYTDADGDFNSDELSTLTDYAGRVTTFGYTSGLVTSITDDYGGVTTLGYSSGKLTSITEPDPDGAGALTAPVTTYTYTGNLLASITDPEGNLTEFTYTTVPDNVKFVSSVEYPGSAVEDIETVFAVALASNTQLIKVSDLLETQEDALGNDIVTERDQFGKPKKLTDADGHTTEIDRDSQGRVTQITTPDPDGVGPETEYAITYDFDANGNLIEAVYPDSTVEEWTYNLTFNLPTEYIDRLGNVTIYSRDATYGYVLEERRVVGNVDDGINLETDDVVTTYTYTPTPSLATDPPAGLLASTEDALGRITELDYDEFGNLVLATYAVGTALEASVEYEYTDSLMTAMIDELGRRTEFVYDSLRRLIETTLPDPDAGGPLAAPVYAYEYDKNNKVVAIIDALGRETAFTYDDRGNRTHVTQPDHDGDTNLTVTEYVFNLANQLTSLIDPLGRTTAFAYADNGWATSTTLPDPDGVGGQASPVVSTTYDALGRTKTTTDALNNVTTYVYSNWGKTVTITLPDPDGVGGASSPVLVMEYDAAGNLISETDALGNETTREYDELGRLVLLVQPDPDGIGGAASPETEYAYDKVGNLRFVTDALLNVTEYVYDERYRLITVIQEDPDGGGALTAPETDYEYDDAGQLVHVADPLGRRIAYQYDGLGRMIAQKQATGDVPAIAVGTTTQGSAIQEVQLVGFSDMMGFSGGTFTLSFDGQTTSGIAYNASAAAVQTALVALSNIGSGDVAVTKVTDLSDSQVWRITFQGSLAGANVVQTTVDSSGVTGGMGTTDTESTSTTGSATSEVQVVTLSNATGGTFRLAFGGEFTSALNYNATAGSLETALEALTTIDNVAVTGSAGGPFTITFQGTLAGDNVIELGFDLFGLTNADLLTTTRFGYDSANRLISRTDALGNVTAYDYDALDNLIETTLPDPDAGGALTTPITTYTFDDVGNRLSLIDPVGNETVWVYDNLNRMIEETNELNDTRTFKYDAMGNLTERVDRLGRKIVWEYDNLYRNTFEKWYSGATLMHTILFEYDANSRLKEASDTAASYGYTFDNLGRVITESQSFGGFSPLIAYDSTYNAVGRRIELEAFVGSNADFENAYSYDDLHRLTGLQQSDQSGGNAVAEKRLDFFYDASSAYTRIDRYADLAGTEYVASTHYAYDGMGRLARLTHNESTTPAAGWGNNPLAGYQYAYDALSRFTGINSYIDGQTDYTHDATSRLIDADHTGQTDEAYDFDENGNRVMSGYTVGTNNRILSDGTYDYEYDDEGNRTAKETIATGAREEYTWDHRNRLTKVTFKNSIGTVTKTVDLVYDAFNQWVKRSIDPDGATGSAALVDTYFSHLDGQIALQFDGADDDDLSHRFLWNPAAVDQVFADENVSSLASAGDVIHPLTDHLGTTRDLAEYDSGTDTTTIVNHRRFDSFGTIVSQTNGSIVILIGFTGRPFDTSTGLQNNLNRWYVSINGVWMSEDPIGFMGGDSNLLRYVRNTPLSATDPSGLVDAGTYADAHPPINDSPPAPSTGLPTARIGDWSPWWFFWNSPYSYRKRGFGCGGIAAFRVLGDEGENPGQVFDLPGVKVYSDFDEALAALKEMDKLGKRGTIMAVQQYKPFIIPGTQTPLSDTLVGVDPCNVGAQDFGNGNFAVLLGTDNKWYWEFANHGWIYSDESTARIRHRTTLPGGIPYILFYVIPADQTKSPSPIPAPGSGDPY